MVDDCSRRSAISYSLGGAIPAEPRNTHVDILLCFDSFCMSCHVLDTAAIARLELFEHPQDSLVRALRAAVTEWQPLHDVGWTDPRKASPS